MGDTLFYNGAIYTMNGDYPEAEALLVRDDRILYVGMLSEAEKMAAADVLRYDLRGRMLLPGFIDAHCHPSLCAFFSSGILLSVDTVSYTHLDVYKRQDKRIEFFTGNGIMV